MSSPGSKAGERRGSVNQLGRERYVRVLGDRRTAVFGIQLSKLGVRAARGTDVRFGRWNVYLYQYRCLFTSHLLIPCIAEPGVSFV